MYCNHNRISFIVIHITTSEAVYGKFPLMLVQYKDYSVKNLSIKNTTIQYSSAVLHTAEVQGLINYTFNV